MFEKILGGLGRLFDAEQKIPCLFMMILLIFAVLGIIFTIAILTGELQVIEEGAR